MFYCTCVLASLGQLCCMAQAEMTLKLFTTMESGSSEDRYSALDSGYWFTLRLLLTSTRILPEEKTHGFWSYLLLAACTMNVIYLNHSTSLRCISCFSTVTLIFIIIIIIENLHWCWKDYLATILAMLVLHTFIVHNILKSLSIRSEFFRSILLQHSHQSYTIPFLLSILPMKRSWSASTF